MWPFWPGSVFLLKTSWNRYDRHISCFSALTPSVPPVSLNTGKGSTSLIKHSVASPSGMWCSSPSRQQYITWQQFKNPGKGRHAHVPLCTKSFESIGETLHSTGAPVHKGLDRAKTHKPTIAPNETIAPIRHNWLANDQRAWHLRILRATYPFPFSEEWSSCHFMLKLALFVNAHWPELRHSAYFGIHFAKPRRLQALNADHGNAHGRNSGQAQKYSHVNISKACKHEAKGLSEVRWKRSSCV